MNRDLALLVGRILLVAIFPVAAAYKIVQWPAIGGMLARAGLPYSEYLGMGVIAVELILPLLIILGLLTRWAAAGLILFIIAATYIGHPIWRDPSFSQVMTFLRNLAMIGGFLMLIASGPGGYAMQTSRARRARDYDY